MTAIATIPRATTAVAERQVQQTVQHYEPTFMELVEIGGHLVKTGFLPDHIKNGAQAAAIIMAGRELGMPLMRSLRSLVLVKGKVTEYADSQLARFKTDGGNAKFLTLDENKAVLWLRHPNGDEHTETFTMDDAKRAGLVSGGGMFQKYAKAMLRSRAITAGLKSIGWEGGAGAYDPEELAPTPTVQYPATEPSTAEADPNAMTDAQHDLLTNLLKSHVFTDDERDKVWESATTKAKATKAIERVRAVIADRKAAEKSLAKELQDADSEITAELEEITSE